MRVWLRTFGCRANQYDSERARALIESAGGTIVDTPAAADVALFNSCAVTAEAEAELRRHVRAAAREHRAIRTVVMGCASALDPRRPATESLRRLPAVAALVPGADLAALATALGLPRGSSPPAGAQHSARAVLRIQDGCDEHCTYCVTRIARGANRSRPATEIVAEARALAAVHREIVITGTHIASWGRDTGGSLGGLVALLCEALPEVRFRLSSLEATLVDDHLRSLLRRAPRHVAPFLHAPLQSGSAAVLRRMGRTWYTPERYIEAVLRIVDGRTVFGLSADVIAGFPGETDADHRSTVAVIERLPFTALHVFPYSARPGSGAERLPGQVPGDVRRARAAELRAVAARAASRYRASRSGTRADVIVVDGGPVRRGVTEDLLTVSVADSSSPRGARLDVRLELGPDGLIAFPAATIVP
jgi:threonylcarbamoyladenosine tRNA methylthiotransferase MtaB